MTQIYIPFIGVWEAGWLFAVFFVLVMLATYSGGVIDGLDYNDWEVDNNNFAGGYYSSDLNGDGIVDGLDFLIWEDNNNNFIGSQTP
jgi:hypothetical protein